MLNHHDVLDIEYSVEEINELISHFKLDWNLTSTVLCIRVSVFYLFRVYLVNFVWFSYTRLLRSGGFLAIHRSMM